VSFGGVNETSVAKVRAINCDNGSSTTYQEDPDGAPMRALGWCAEERALEAMEEQSLKDHVCGLN
jgi:hypothetical protein